MSLTLYGIANCDTVKKARTWLADKGRDFTFHDFRKDGLSQDMVERWLVEAPMEKLLNKRGTSWRKLPDADKANEDEAHLIALMVENPTLIKRPVIEQGGRVTVGFTDDVKDVWG
ncbi:MAG: arsenate reductase [PS1 clade bacterium]|jgi:arsenate reductase|uniref:Arsenate reductase n=1 Tax=PS1 clade bacterium TaxID=2175152 RepID=A0A937L2F2_9PROT|nr:arsenate reductase [PS1 clade bacterium]